jgi:ferric-dicitrate binding protein FerR (iron transport regulator)
MDRTKTLTRNAICCLITSLLLFAPKAMSAGHQLGIINQIEGEITYLDYVKVKTVTKVKEKDQLQTDGSYLTHNDAYFNVHLFDGSWLRLNPKSKISLEFYPETKTLTIFLLTGSMKILLDIDRKEKKLEKVIVQSAGATFETVGAKFTVTRNLLMDQSSVYVEKGTVVATQYVQYQKQDMELVHAKEKTTINDREKDVESPRKMTDKEIHFLNPKNYLYGADKSL